MLVKHPDLLTHSVTTETLCSKNVGEPKKLRKWSRGHQFVVRAGGHIDMWQPLYTLVLLQKTLQYHTNTIHDTHILTFPA